jgi:hypothetical protein
MPAIASLEDLKSAQKEGLDIYGMCYSSLQSRTRDTSHGHVLNEKWRKIGWKNVCGAPMRKGRAIFKGWVGATSRPQVNGFLCRGKLWLEERTPEQLKGEG